MLVIFHFHVLPVLFQFPAWDTLGKKVSLVFTPSWTQSWTVNWPNSVAVGLYSTRLHIWEGPAGLSSNVWGFAQILSTFKKMKRCHYLLVPVAVIHVFRSECCYCCYIFQFHNNYEYVNKSSSHFCIMFFLGYKVLLQNFLPYWT